MNRADFQTSSDTISIYILIVAHYIQQLYVGMPLDELKEAADNGTSVIETAKKRE